VVSSMRIPTFGSALAWVLHTVAAVGLAMGSGVARAETAARSAAFGTCDQDERHSVTMPAASVSASGALRAHGGAEVEIEAFLASGERVRAAQARVFDRRLGTHSASAARQAHG